MALRRYSEMKPSQGTVWPKDVREHIEHHQKSCVGALAGMDGMCDRFIELDHIRASGGIGMKSKSIATNGARMCSLHHRLKTMHGKTWRPVLIDVVNLLAAGCASCEQESINEWGVALDSDYHAACVDPCGSTCRAAG